MKSFFGFENIVGDTDSVDSIKRQVNERRSLLYSYDKSLLEKTDIKLDFNSFDTAPDGRFEISYKDIDFECFFKRNTDSDSLYVVLNGYRSAGQNEPTFKRWSYYKFIGGNLLNIDDPMTRIYTDLGLGWYYGTKDEC